MGRFRGRRALLGLGLAVLARPALATTAADLCAASADPCVVDRTISVSSGSTLDLGSRALEIRRTGTLDVGAGTMTINAGSLRLVPGALLSGHGGTLTIVTTGPISVEASGTTQARVDVSGGAQGGQIDMTAGGAVTLAGTLTARATGRGGTISVAAGADLVSTGPITVSGGAGSDGGDVRLSTPGRLSIGGGIDASGGSDGGGSITLDAGDIATTVSLDVSARVGGGDAGSIAMTATGSVSLQGPIAAGSDCSARLGCDSTGGEITIDANGGVTIGAQVALFGAGPDGNAGTLDVDAGTDVVQTGAIVANGRGTDGCGGDVTISAARNLTLGAIDVSGGSCGGGTLGAQAVSTASIAGEITADSRSTGAGGSIALGGETVDITGRAHASGPSLTGGSVTVDGCRIDLGAAAGLEARGEQGTNVLSASGEMTIAGLLASGGGVGGTGGRNELRFRDQSPTITATASIVPAPVVVPDSTLPSCGGTLPPGCGNGQLDPGETCDDGNTASCDGCSATCLLEGCGNGRRECAEACDDGNVVACDGCSPTCQLEGCGNGIVECGEECDAGAANGTPGAGCDATCHIPPPLGCGNGALDAGETCDDGNTTACDGCSATCQVEACGNGVRECAEECDDGNTTACDGCSATCRLEACGNGIRECDEECDDGPANGTPGAVCDATCHRATVCVLVTDPSCVPCARDTDCDPQGRCVGLACAAGACVSVAAPACADDKAGTLDRCVLDEAGAPQCTHICIADSACDDGNACNGAEACVAGACVPGAPPTCDDGDACTDDACDTVRGCVHVTRVGLAGVGCRIDGMRALVAAAGEGDLALRFRRALPGRLARLRARIDAVAAAAAARDVGRERRLLARASLQLLRVGNLIGRARRLGVIDPGLGDRLVTALKDAYDGMIELRRSLGA